MKEVDGELEYQGVAVDNIDKVVDQCKKHVLADIDRLQQSLTRLFTVNSLLLYFACDLIIKFEKKLYPIRMTDQIVG